MIPNDLALKLGDLGQVGAYTYLDFISHPAYLQEEARIAVTRQPDASVSVYLETNPVEIEELIPLNPNELTKKRHLEELLETIHDTFRKQEAQDYFFKQTADDLIRFEKPDQEKILLKLDELTQRNAAYRVLLSTNQDYLDELPANHELQPFYNKLAKLYYQGNTISAASIEKLQATRREHVGHKKLLFTAAGIYAANHVRKKPAKQLATIKEHA